MVKHMCKEHGQTLMSLGSLYDAYYVATTLQNVAICLVDFKPGNSSTQGRYCYQGG